jgi:two-component system sensor histidine kinase KdpD
MTSAIRPFIHDVIVDVLLVVASTLIVYALAAVVDVHYLIALYLVPIVFAMLRTGFVQSLLVTLLSALAVAFFFYEPLYSLYVADPEELIELVIFAVLAVVIAYLVTVLRDLRRMGPDEPR